MTVRTPAPLAAAVGLVAATADGVRRIPSLLVGLPPSVARQVETARQVARERYDELALHGRDVLAGRHAGVAGDADPDADALTVLIEAPEPPPPVPPLGRTEVVEIPEDVLEEVAQLTPGGELAHADLPLPDFDHQTVPQLRGRLRTLALPELVQLRDYEQAHARRLPVLTLLDNRIATLSETAAAEAEAAASSTVPPTVPILPDPR